MSENMLEKIEIRKIEKEQFDEYKDEIEKYIMKMYIQTTDI